MGREQAGTALAASPSATQAAATQAAGEPLLSVRDLRVAFTTESGRFRAVDGVSFAVHPGRTLGIVGESGCGKSVTSLSVMGLLAKAGRIETGEIRFDGADLLTLSDDALRDLRGNRLAMIFQEPMTSLNPAYSIGDQIIEGVLRHRKVSRREARERAIEMLRRVGIPMAEKRVDEYPHKLSGGMRQRAMIAMALACDPKMLIADEPTTALDVTIQAQILDLMRALRRETGTAIMLITHDLGVIAEMADDVIVMYAGRVVEQTSVGELFARPEHPYTVGLLGSIPRLERPQERLAAIEGIVPSAANLPKGCRFSPRCPLATDHCRAEDPPLMEIRPGHWSACWRAPLEATLNSIAWSAGVQ